MNRRKAKKNQAIISNKENNLLPIKRREVFLHCVHLKFVVSQGMETTEVHSFEQKALLISYIPKNTWKKQQITNSKRKFMKY